MSSKPDFAHLEKEVGTDEQLLRVYAAKGVGSARSFKVLFDRYYNRVHAYFMFKGALPDVADDLAQEVFLRVVLAARTFDQNRGTLRAWLFTIATNIFKDHLRKNGELRSVPLEDCENALSYMPPQIQQLDQLLQNMESDLRVPLELSVLCGLTATEIAQVLELPEGTIYSRIYRARRHLRRKLDPGEKIKRIPRKVFKPTLEPPREIQISLSFEEDYRNE